MYSPQHERLFGGISDETVAGIKKFDIELFAAHLDDWRMRVCEIGTISHRITSCTQILIQFFFEQRTSQTHQTFQRVTRN